MLVLVTITLGLVAWMPINLNMSEREAMFE
jgi:hypothetical protein